MRKTITVSQRPVLFRRPSPDLNIAIRSDVILGSPSARCNGVGICRVMGIGEHPDCPCPRVGAILSTSPGGAIQFRFEKKDLSALQHELHFQWGLFTVVEPYRVSARMCKKLGWKTGWINPGTYRVWETDTTLTVIFEETAPVTQA
jgi:hypothetical protein